MEASALHAPAVATRPGLRPRALRLRSDDQLLALFRGGSDEAFTVLVDRYRTRLLAYTRRMLGGSQHDAEDALQDVFVRAYGALRADERPVSVRAWLYRVAHNRCIDQIRRTGPAPEDVYAVSRGTALGDPADAAEQREALQDVVRDVGALPETQRSALLLRELDGLSYNELAATLDMTLPAIKSLLVRARTSLAEAGEARATPCAEIRVDLETAVDTGVRPDGRARRHVRECDPCRDYQHALRGATAGTHQAGPIAFFAKLLGIGGAGAGGSTAAVGGAVSTKVAALVCCGVVAVGAGAVYEIPRELAPSTPAPVRAPERGTEKAVAAAFALPAVSSAGPTGTARTGSTPRTAAKPVERTAPAATAAPRQVSVEPVVATPVRTGGTTGAGTSDPTTVSGTKDVTSGGQTGTSSEPGTGLSTDGRAPGETPPPASTPPTQETPPTQAPPAEAPPTGLDPSGRTPVAPAPGTGQTPPAGTTP